MAHAAQPTTAYVSADRTIFEVLGRALRAFGKAFSMQAGMQTRMNRISRLNAMSDAELAELGIQRDRIVHHVFRDIYYV